MNTKIKYAIAVYILIAILTFGHAFKTGQILIANPHELDAVLFFALMDCLFWPFYWSVQFWK